ncbi:uncharacterized protein LOC111891014 [Lactuca sativa]|uniref:uncharacterized protein LOC111891014 n=1 Tax=Lactuca sativa TaxID=4236 RepID=UPI001C68AB41|nr:uncharacterized protein LOC111891014 [Lactuca sativa]
MDWDLWRCSLSSDWNFCVRDLRKLIDSKLIACVWCRLVPLKVIIFTWWTCMDRVPYTIALSRRGINVPTTTCYSYTSGLDDTYHILLGCSFAQDTLLKILNWCKILFQQLSSVAEMVNFAANRGNCPKKKLHLAIFYDYLWCV